MLHGPGKYLFMMIWWILAFFFVQLQSCPLQTYLSSYLVYFIAFPFVLAVAVLLDLLEWRTAIWSRRRLWGRFVVLATAYTVAIGASLVATVVLDSYRLVRYFGGDAGGSFGLLYLPRIVVYWLGGGAVCGLVQLCTPRE